MANPVTRVDSGFKQQGQGFSGPLQGTRYALGGAGKGVAASMMDGESSFTAEFEEFNLGDTDVTSADWTADAIGAGTGNAGTVDPQSSMMKILGSTEVSLGAAYGLFADPITAFSVVETRVAGTYTYVWAARVAIGAGTSGVANTWSDKVFIGSAGSTADVLAIANDVATPSDLGLAGFHIKSDGTFHFLSSEIATGATSVALDMTAITTIGTANVIPANLDALRVLDLGIRIKHAGGGGDGLVEGFVNGNKVASIANNVPVSSGDTPNRPVIACLNGATNTHTAVLVDWMVTAASRMS